MAINTTYFSDVGTGHITEIYNYLSVNATEYFDSIVLSDDGYTISCYIGDLLALTLYRLETGYQCGFTVYLENGTSINKHSGTSTKSYLHKIVKTDCGLAICYGTYKASLIISKSDTDETILCFAATIKVASSEYWIAAIPTSSVSFGEGFHTGYGACDASVTVLAPVACVDNPGYAPNVYYMPYTQYRATEGVLTLNNKNYYTNGYIALAE